MALISCPQCKEKIADTAKVCPHCGHVLSEEVSKKSKEATLILKRERASYTLDILIMVLPLSLIALELLNKYLLLLSIPLALLCLGWGILSLRKKKVNNQMMKDLIYFDQSNKTLTCFDINMKEYTFTTDLLVKVRKENLITQRVYLTYRVINQDNNTYTIKRLDLGYSKTSEVKAFQSKLKNLVDIDVTVEE